MSIKLNTNRIKIEIIHVRTMARKITIFFNIIHYGSVTIGIFAQQNRKTTTINEIYLHNHN